MSRYKGADILKVISRIIFDDDFNEFSPSWSFLYPIPYLASVIWEKYQVGLALRRQGHEFGLTPRQYEFALFMLDELQKYPTYDTGKFADVKNLQVLRIHISGLVDDWAVRSFLQSTKSNKLDSIKRALYSRTIETND